jgi:hypothetical protein
MSGIPGEKTVLVPTHLEMPPDLPDLPDRVGMLHLGVRCRELMNALKGAPHPYIVNSEDMAYMLLAFIAAGDESFFEMRPQFIARPLKTPDQLLAQWRSDKVRFEEKMRLHLAKRLLWQCRTSERVGVCPATLRSLFLALGVYGFLLPFERFCHQVKEQN